MHIYLAELSKTHVWQESHVCFASSRCDQQWHSAHGIGMLDECASYNWIHSKLSQCLTCSKGQPATIVNRTSFSADKKRLI